MAVRGAIPSPNLWRTPELYELGCRAFDPDGAVAAALGELVDLSGRDVLDIGCGSGYELPRLAAAARSVVGVEPHAASAARARRRTARLGVVSVVSGTAQRLPLPPASVDVAHARWAYFFGPGCEPGLSELTRVIRRGGMAVVVDNDAGRSTFGSWFRRGFPSVDPVAVDRFWSSHGWSRVSVSARWSFESRADLEAVVRIELDAATADRVLAGHRGAEVDYAVNLWWRGYE